MGRGALALVVALVAGCGGDGDGSPTATLEPGPTTERTTTTLSPEDEVEAAYLESWEVYADAVRTFDTSRLEDSFEGAALQLVIDEVDELRAANTPIVVQVEHDVDIQFDGGVAFVRDTYVNRNYRVDGETNEPIDDPDDPGTYVELYEMREAEETWRVAAIVRESYSP